MKRTLMSLIALGFGAAAVADDKPAPDSVQDLIFLGENRPVFLRLRIKLGDRPFRSAWMDSVKAMHAYLDRNGDGVVTKDEADKGNLATVVRVANGGATAMPRGEIDNHPRDGVISVDELSDALRTSLGPFRVQTGKVASGKTDALFEHLDRDKDGHLTKSEMGQAADSLRKLDLDDDELIDGAELEPFANPLAVPMTGNTGPNKYTAVPPVIELTAEESSIRPVRLLVKRYDKGGDNKLSLAEFAIDPKSFIQADADGDKALDTEELRRFLAKVLPDLELNVTLSPDATGSATVVVAGNPSAAAGTKVTQLAGGDLEVAVDEIRLEVHVDDGGGAAANAKASFNAQFQAADADNNGYLEKSETNKDKDHPSPLNPLFEVLDRDGDGKLYLKEVDDFIDRQALAARSRMVLTTSDQGRAIFAILDLNRDRRLGLREVRGTTSRVTTWDRNGDGKIAADEIPHHYQLTLARGQIAGLANPNAAIFPGSMNLPAPEAVASGPNWFRKMDRNGDRDVSRREFFGPKAQFERLDKDKDGLIDPAEAGGVGATVSASALRVK